MLALLQLHKNEAACESTSGLGLANVSSPTLTKSMGRGFICCVVGCNCSSRKCLGLSFFSLPRRGVSKEQDEWRASLIHAISRSDKSFNPATAKICSRHFEEKCIRKSNYQTLVCASIFSPFSLLCAHQKFRICP